jgi:hypothetical protein
MERLVYFCDGPWAGKQGYIKYDIDYYYVGELPKLPLVGEEIDVTKLCAKKYRYRIEGNYAIFEGEDN